MIDIINSQCINKYINNGFYWIYTETPSSRFQMFNCGFFEIFVAMCCWTTAFLHVRLSTVFLLFLLWKIIHVVSQIKWVEFYDVKTCISEHWKITVLYVIKNNFQNHALKTCFTKKTSISRKMQLVQFLNRDKLKENN